MYITLHIAYCICWRSFGLNIVVGLPVNVVDEEVWLKVILPVDLILSVVEFVLLLILFNRVVAAFLIGNFCLFEKPIKEYVNGHIRSSLSFLLEEMGWSVEWNPRDPEAVLQVRNLQSKKLLQIIFQLRFGTLDL